MPARFKAQARADPVEPFQEILPPLRHRRAPQQGCPTGNKADRVAGGVTIDAEEGVAHFLFRDWSEGKGATPFVIPAKAGTQREARLAPI
ncbi:hypothetical protein GCM10011317_43750 [Niveispirillum cyanobacteriorum]|nr:hypothetical protein GCM10011317_43750 [Niveispirillum cyanobacteriorum]